MPKGKHGNHPKANRQRNWSEKRMLASNGYVKIRVGRSHPLADPNGYAYEHLVIWVAAGNSRPPKGYVLHHKNEVKTDNRIDNLELVTRAAHNSAHLAERGRCPRSGRLLSKADALLDGREWRQFPEPAREPAHA